jgi:deoxyadenosine kinase
MCLPTVAALLPSRQRSRDCETSISIEYLRALERGYEEFIDHISQLIPVIRINWSKYRSAEEMAEVIVQEYAKMKNIRHVNFEKKVVKAVSPA